MGETGEARVEEVEELAEHLYDVLRAVTLETGAATGPPWSSVLSRRFAQVLIEYERVLHGAS